MSTLQPSDFLGLEAPDNDDERAEVVIFPVPFERTTSYGRGTAGGPAALLDASQYVELWDEELELEPSAGGIATAPLFLPRSAALGEALQEIEDEARRHLEAGKYLVTVGGEHSLSIAPIRAVVEHFRPEVGEIGVIQFDAHADLRDAYEGTPHSHACIMRRAHELGLPLAAIGLRGLSRPEHELIHRERLPVIWGHQLDRADALFDDLLDALPEAVYLTFDVDYFDPSLMPATGTPEPGGGFWNPTLALLRRLFARKRVLAFDVVELAPTAGSRASDYLAAKLVSKCLGYRLAARRDG